ncbi:hypothetical protein BDQ17DRAFT_1364614 [Cyathus striatus]|nr:hypothetical protein BDQ17DRAFT_1364614 [Cyathus striatus]
MSEEQKSTEIFVEIQTPTVVVVGDSDLWADLEQLYKRNKDAIDRYAALDVRKSTAATLDSMLGGFNEAAKVVLDGLVVVGNIHPIVGAAVFAFHLVIGLDLKRRENNKKVLVVKVQMLSMMCALFQLRELKAPSETGIANESLTDLVKAISNEIKECGNDCDCYSKKKPLSKFIKANGYEKQFSDHIERFAQRREQLNLQLLLYLGRKQEEMESKLDSIQLQLSSLPEEILKAFRSSREVDVLDFIASQKKSDISECLKDDNIFSKLLSKAGEAPPSYEDAQRAQSERKAIRDTLLKELKEDLTTELRQNMTSFEGKLKLQNESLQVMKSRLERVGNVVQHNSQKLDDIQISIKEEGKVILRALTLSRYENIKDHEMQKIWRAMGLGTSVKARHFILTLRDHFLETNSNMNTTRTSPLHMNVPLPGSLNEEQGEEHLKPPLNFKSIYDDKELRDNTWALQYLDVSHFRQIVDAIDEDSSGFISIKEANKFSLARPKHWLLLEWFAFWAAGSDMMILSYQARIYTILSRMHDMIDKVLPANRSLVDKYLDTNSLHRVELLLRSIKVTNTAESDVNLKKLTVEYMTDQEKTLLSNFETVNHLIDSEETLALVVGQAQGRIEVNILPLLYLLLKRHSAIFALSRSRYLDSDEMGDHITSFTTIFSVFNKRMKHLEAIFQHTRQDPSIQFEIYASGWCFLASYKNTETDPWSNSISSGNKDCPLGLSVEDDDTEGDDAGDDNNGHYDTENHGIEDHVHEESNSNELEHREKSTASPDLASNKLLRYPEAHQQEFDDGHSWPSMESLCPLEGFWSGTYKSRSTEGRLFWAIISSGNEEHSITGWAEKYVFKVAVINFATLHGTYSHEETTETISVNVTMMPEISDQYLTLQLSGEFDPILRTIKGCWKSIEESTEIIDLLGNISERTFQLIRHDHNAQRARFILDASEAVMSDPRNIENHDLLAGIPRAIVADFRLNMSDCVKLRARARWLFAIYFILAKNRSQTWSWASIQVACQIRRSCIRMTTGHKYENSRRYIPETLSEGGLQMLWNMRRLIHPTSATLYDALSEYLFDRGLHRLGKFLRCDACGKEIFWRRYLCIICNTETLDNQVDLCISCVNIPSLFTGTGFRHEQSHTLLQMGCYKQNYLHKWVILEAREMSDRIKSAFRAQETTHELHPASDSERTTTLKKTLITCKVCGVPVKLPCLVCVICAPDQFYCESCVYTGFPVLINEKVHKAYAKIKGYYHRGNHPLLRISDSTEVKTRDTKEEDRVEKNLTVLGNRLSEKYSLI